MSDHEAGPPDAPWQRMPQQAKIDMLFNYGWQEAAVRYAPVGEDHIGDEAYSWQPDDTPLLMQYLYELDQFPRTRHRNSRDVMHSAREAYYNPEHRAENLKGIVEGFLGMVVNQAFRIVQPGESIMTLIGAGNLALVEAVVRYSPFNSPSPPLGLFRTKTFVAMLIARENERHLVDFDEQTALNVSHLRRTATNSFLAHNWEADLEELARKPGMPEAEVREAMAIDVQFSSPYSTRAAYDTDILDAVDLDVENFPSVANEPTPETDQTQALPTWAELELLFTKAALSSMEIAVVGLRIGQELQGLAHLVPEQLHDLKYQMRREDADTVYGQALAKIRILLDT